jgi:Ca2+-binding RTX toxin-like protein
VTVNLADGSGTGAGGEVHNFSNVTGGAGDDLIVGDGLANRLLGNGGRDILIGSAGQDTVTGGGGDDLLIGGSTAFDRDPSLLTDLRAEWVSTETYANRIDHLTGTPGGANGTTYLMAGGTAVDDAAKDVLTGGVGSDWFAAGALDKIDLKSPEQKLLV